MADTKNDTKTNPAERARIAPLIGEGTPLEVRDAAARDLILGARDNPDGTRMPDGSTVTEFRAAQSEAHAAEGEAAIAKHEARARELSTEGDPLYVEGAVVQPTETGSTVILPAPPARAPSGDDGAKGSQGSADETGLGQPPAATRTPGLPPPPDAHEG